MQTLSVVVGHSSVVVGHSSDLHVVSVEFSSLLHHSPKVVIYLYTVMIH